MAVSKKNKKITKLLMYTPREIKKMDKEQLGEVIHDLSKYANTRLAALRKKRFTETPAYVQVRESGRRKFTENNKTLNQLRNEYIAVKQFLENKTSTVPQAKKYYKRIQEIVGRKLTNPQLRELWDVYHMLRQDQPSFMDMIDSDKIIKLITKQMNKKSSVDEIFEKVRDIVQKHEAKAQEEGFNINERDVISFEYEDL